MIKTFEKFRQNLPDFEFTGKLKKIIINIYGDKVIAQSGSWSGNERTYLANSEEDDYKNTFYFKTDKINTIKLKKHGIVAVKSIENEKRIITFELKNNEILECPFKIKWFSTSDIGNKFWNEVEDDDYVTWSI